MRPSTPNETATTWTHAGPNPLLKGSDVFLAQRPDGVLAATRTRDNGQWHISVVPPTTRLPTWGEMLAARHLAPDDVTMAYVFPPAAEYVNLVENCLHLWQIAGPRHGAPPCP